MDDMTVRLQDVAATLDELQTLLHGEETLELVLERLAETAKRTIPAAAAVSVTVMADYPTGPWTATATDAMVIAIDHEQYVTGQGPCLEAARTRLPLRVSVEDARHLWPAFAKVAAKAGIRSYLSAPLMLGDEPVLGALNVYGRAPDAFDPVDEALLSLFTAASSSAIVSSRSYARARDFAEQMKNALTSRAEIEQAKGVLMARHLISADEAFAMLAQESQDNNVKLRDVARSLLETAIGAARETRSVDARDRSADGRAFHV
jgi:GAF domain-containing protein